MATIKINDTQFEATLAQTSDRLTLTLNTAQTLDELAALFAPGTAPEVRVLDYEGLTAAIYSNRKIVEVAVRIDGEDRRAVVSLQVEPIEQSVAERLQERLDAQEQNTLQLRQTISTQQATINEQQRKIPHQQAEIERQQDTISTQQVTIDDQQQTIVAQQAQIDELKQAVDIITAPIDSLSPTTGNEEVQPNDQQA